MIRIVEFLIAIVLVVVIFVVVGLCLPSHRHVFYTTETNRPLPVVFDILSGFKRYRDWTPIRSSDSHAQFSVSGPDSGKGARVDYTSRNPEVGKGSWEVTDSVSGTSISYSLNNGDLGSNKTMEFRFKKVGNQLLSVEITQDYDVDYGWNLFGRYAGLYVTRSVGDLMKTGLNNLNNFLATIPKFDYTQLGAAPTIVPTPAENLLFAPTKSKRDNDQVRTDMQTQEKWLHQVMDKNGLVATGPLRVVTTDFGAETYSYDVAIPVAKTGAPPAPGASSAPATPSAPGTLPQLDVKIDGANNPVKYVQTQPGSAISARYSGNMAGLPAIHESMKAWATVHDYAVAERPYDLYTKGITDSFSDAGEYTLFWPIKAPSSK